MQAFKMGEHYNIFLDEFEKRLLK